MVRGPISMAVAGIVMLVMFALVAGGPRVFDKVLPESAVAWLETMGSGSSGVVSINGGMSDRLAEGADPNDPNSYLRDTSDGWSANPRITPLQGGGLAFVAQVLDGHSTRFKDAAPGAITTLTEVEGCTFTAPDPAAHIGHVRAARGTRIGLATYNDSHIAEAVQVLVKLYRAKGFVQKSTLGDLTYEVFDVAVTETAKPVYLVLERPHGRGIFNINLAPGARLERVVLIGGEQVGVSNLPPGVPVEVMRATKASACGFNPFYRLNPNALYFQSVENGVISEEEQANYEANFTAWENAWEGAFRAAFGVGAASSLSGNVDDVLVATVGPVPATPEARAVWAQVKGAAMQVTVDTYIEYAGQPEGQDFDSMVKAVAKAFAWGDLANLSEGVQF